MNKIVRIINTVKFLKPIQLYSRFYYLFRSRFRRILKIKYLYSKKSTTTKLTLQKSIHINDCFLGDNEFNFLNLSKKFSNDIDWNYSQYGKLWTYNLNYFDFLTQEYNPKLLELIHDYVRDMRHIKDGMEPFPISLRGINWIKFLTYNELSNHKINNSLYAQYYILVDNIEYHLLGNHLLENAFSLLYGAYYFQDDFLYEKSKKILIKELNEQVLGDGAHFELSPMYHQIMLFRLLDCINLVKNNGWRKQELLEFLTQKARLMLGWLKAISYQNNTIPHLNDSTNGIAPTSEQLYEYAKRLMITVPTLTLKESGYRKILTSQYELIIDIGDIGPTYIPGHAHSDTFNFELMVNQKPFIVDTGLSTYETSERRTVERSTLSHNTVECMEMNQSEVWAGFRVANRARVVELHEDVNYIRATHDGYKKLGCEHSRKWEFDKSKIVIEDSLSKEINSIARLHFHPSIRKEEIEQSITINVEGSSLKRYQYASGFNKTADAYVLEIPFTQKLSTEILIN